MELNKTCPKCKQNAITINKMIITCSSCDFEVRYACPICQNSLNHSDFNENESFTCNQCNHTIPVKKIKNLIENALIVDHEQEWEFCNGPTVHREDVNLSSRCFFYPTCSGQVNLFADKKESYVFLDFETTGLEIGRNEIIEIGALKIDEEGYEHTYQALIKPKEAIPPKITSITGITNDMVTDSPPITDVINEFIEFLGNSTIVAHNAEFDVPWLITTCIKEKLDIIRNDVICTLKWAKQSKESRCSLGVLTKKYGITHNNAHRALADAVATKEIFFIFENQKVSEKPNENIDGYIKTSQNIIKKYERLLA